MRLLIITITRRLKIISSLPHPPYHTNTNISPVRRSQKFIVSGGVAGEVRVWEVRSRELVCHLKEHNARVNSGTLLGVVCMAADVSVSGYMRVWVLVCVHVWMWMFV